MPLLWAVPVVAAALAALLLSARGRALEAESARLAGAVRDLRALRAPLAAVRAATGETDALAAAFRARHPLERDRGADR